MNFKTYSPFDDSLESAGDSAIISAALAGDSRSLEELVRRHQSWIFNIALRMAGNADEAGDITQEVLVKVITGLSGYDPLFQNMGLPHSSEPHDQHREEHLGKDRFHTRSGFASLPEPGQHDISR